MHPVVKLLERRGWKIGLRSDSVLLLPEDLSRQFAPVPKDFVEFMAPLDMLENPEGTVWFLTATHYNAVEPDGFRWNEYMHMALDGAENAEAVLEIEAFWSSHLPFALAVHSDYDYLAVRTRGSMAGSIVHGFAPSWEDPSVISPSFSVFIESYLHAVESEVPEYPYSVFL